MRIIRVDNVEKFTIKRPGPSGLDRRRVSHIMTDIQKNGDKALFKYEKKFGTIKGSLLVSKKEIRQAYKLADSKAVTAIRKAAARLASTEKALMARLRPVKSGSRGVSVSRKFTPLDSVGCYAPGGRARYPSSVVMSVVPAKIAGVRRIVVASPPNPDGMADPLTLVAADICGATEVYKAGGAQAIAALAYGTRTIRPVDKIVGPGGKYVTLAKSLVPSHVAIDMQAGPTELGIIADASSDVQYIAADLLSQAEHGPDSFCHVITTSMALAEKVNDYLNWLVDMELDRAQSTLDSNGFIAVCKNKRDVIRLAQMIAAEHLEIHTTDARAIAAKLSTPGLVLIGPMTPSSASDYMLGSNHILPTCRAGRTRGSLSVLDYLKLATMVESDERAIARTVHHIKALTDAEGLPYHYDAVRVRSL